MIARWLSEGEECCGNVELARFEVPLLHELAGLECVEIVFGMLTLLPKKYWSGEVSEVAEDGGAFVAAFLG